MKRRNKRLCRYVEGHLAGIGSPQACVLSGGPEGTHLVVYVDFSFPEGISDEVKWGYKPVISIMELGPSVIGGLALAMEKGAGPSRDDRNRPEIRRYAKTRFWFIQDRLSRAGLRDTKLRNL
ncbi:MAG: hypothetical protein ACPLRM_07295, partial [Anaerolineae bacterium]